MTEYLLENLPRIPADFWAVLREMSPYLLFGFLMAGLLSVLISAERIERHLGGRGIGPILKASAFGVPLPLCSCGVIPVSASLRRHGASRGATTAFLLSTPQTGVDSILVTYSLLGGAFAVFRPLAALVSGLLGGAMVDLLDRRDGRPASGAEACRDACCDAAHRHGRLRRILTYGFSTLPRDIGRPLLVGLAIAALISALVPKDYFAPLLGGGVGAMLILMGLGIPVYVCATASVPIALSLVQAGASPGAAFAFLVTGPATNAATIVMVWKVMGPRTALLYLLTVAVSAVAGGLLLDVLVTPQAVLGAHHHAHHAMGMGWTILSTACAVALLGVLAAAILRGRPRKEEAVPAERAHLATLLTVSGMTCSHCADAVRRALERCPGVESAQVSLERGQALVGGDVLDADCLRREVESLGYRVTDLRPAHGAPTMGQTGSG